jgi:hypothetical protein
LIVSDGSLAISQFRGRLQHHAPASLSSIEPFEAAGHRFVCVGYVGERNGPTLVWKTSRV